MNKYLFNEDSDSDGDSTPVLKTNKDYAKSYNSFRQKELKQKLKDRGQAGSDLETDSESDDSSSEDEVSENEEFDEAFFKTLASLKSKDPQIYNKQVNFFEKFDSKEAIAGGSKKSAKPFTVKDLEREVILEKGGVFEDDEEGGSIQRSESPTLVEKEKKLKQELKKALDDNSEEEDGNWGGLFVKRKKDENTEQDEEKQYALWLAGQTEKIKKEDEKVLSSLKNYWSSSTLTKEEKFLRDYLLKSKYKEGGNNPTYEDIVGEGNDQLSEDEKDLEQQEQFEQKYNFRFEEPDKDFLKSYPRTIEWSVRAEDDRRKQKRAEVKDRKVKEKEQRRQDMEILKEMKRKEIQDKIDKLKLVTGNEELPINDDFLDQDFDPDEHDRKMQAIFNDEYYQVDEGEEKPSCPEDIDELKVEDWDNYDPNDEKEENPVEELGEDDNMDCEYDPQKAKEHFQNEMIDSTRGRKKRKRRSKFAEVISKDKPVFNPEDEKTYAEYIDEYYKMDYEDIIGDTPCRFKYVETVPNDFGLSVEEILIAKNKELNQWVSLKKAVQIRPEHIERNEVKQYQMRATNWNLKKKILKSVFTEKSESEDEGDSKTQVKTTPKLSKPEKNANEKIIKTEIPTEAENKPIVKVDTPNKKKKNKKKQKNNKNNGVAKTPNKNNTEKVKDFKKKSKELLSKDPNSISDNRLRALGLNPKKYHNKIKYGNKNVQNVNKKQ